jgi:hypothetical protein
MKKGLTSLLFFSNNLNYSYQNIESSENYSPLSFASSCFLNSCQLKRKNIQTNTGPKDDDQQDQQSREEKRELFSYSPATGVF